MRWRASSTTTSSRAGLYQFLDVPPGNYRLEARAGGFAPYSASNVMLIVKMPSTMNIQFQLAGTVTSVTVEGQAPLIHRTDASLGNTVEENQIAELPDVERVPKHDGRLSLRVRGIEFAELVDGEMWFGMDQRRAAHPRHAPEIAGVVEELAGARCESGDRLHPLYRQYPEAWLESQVRSGVEQIDATLRIEPVYGQVPAFAGGDRGILDLLAVDHSGRLVVVELKASEDPQLPLQALDYWIRVKWHLDRGEFRANGYFPGVELRPEPPRLLLVSPALEFHPASETILDYFSPRVEVERIGLGLEWRKGLQVVFRLTAPWCVPSSQRLSNATTRCTCGSNLTPSLGCFPMTEVSHR